MKRTILISVAAVTLTAAEPQHYTVTDLGPVGQYGQPFSVSNNELIAGVDASGGASHAVVWYKGQKTDTSGNGFGGLNSIGFDINIKGQFVGEAETSTPSPYREDFCGFGTNVVCLPFTWQFGLMTPLPTLGGEAIR